MPLDVQVAELCQQERPRHIAHGMSRRLHLHRIIDGFPAAMITDQPFSQHF